MPYYVMHWLILIIVKSFYPGEDEPSSSFIWVAITSQIEESK